MATDLRKLERDAFRRFYEDGLFDVYLGLMLLAFVVASVAWEMLGDEAVSYVVMLALVLGVTVPLLAYRRRLLRQRLGRFSPGPRRKLRLTRTRWVLLGSVVLGVAVFGLATVATIGPGSVDLVALVVPAIWFANAVVVFGAMGYLLDVPRFYAYGLVGGLIMPLLVWPETLWGVAIPAWLIFGAAALAVVALGLHKLRRFLRRYPVPPAHPDRP
jgi:hypothetical protein